LVSGRNAAFGSSFQLLPGSFAVSKTTSADGGCSSLRIGEWIGVAIVQIMDVSWSLGAWHLLFMQAHSIQTDITSANPTVSGLLCRGQ
jgi:hypothetical protein